MGWYDTGGVGVRAGGGVEYDTSCWSESWRRRLTLRSCGCSSSVEAKKRRVSHRMVTSYFNS